STPTEAPRPRAVLVGVQLAGVTDAEQRSSLTELKRLCETLGFDVVGEVTQKRQGLGAATLLGEGKLAELAGWTGGTGVVPKGPPGKKKKTTTEATPRPAGEPRATVVVVDHDLSPRQLRLIEGATSAAAVLDRTGVIIEIFNRHASSRPARLQVEIARLNYVAPRSPRWSSTAARSATASPSSRRSWPPSTTSRGCAGRSARRRCASPWSV